MATKMYNAHIDKILSESKRYYTTTVYVYLVHISNEIKAKNKDLLENNSIALDSLDNKRESTHFFIQTGQSLTSNTIGEDLPFKYHRKALVDVLCKYIKKAERRTIYRSILELENLNILSFNEVFSAWELNDMANMFANKNTDEKGVISSPKKGYTPIKDILLSESFKNCKPHQRKLWLYLCQLKYSKASEEFRRYNKADFVVNILDNPSWKNILHTKSKYYAKYRLETFLKDNEKTIVNLKDDELSSSFKFKFDIPSLSKTVDEDTYLESYHYKDISMIKQRIAAINRYLDERDLSPITLSLDKIYQLVRAIMNVKHISVKEEVITVILRKYMSIQVYGDRENIKSLPAYAYRVVRTVLTEFENKYCTAY